MNGRFFDFILPALTVLCAVLLWELGVRFYETPSYILPAPSLILITLYTDWQILSPALYITLVITLLGLCMSIALGLALAMLFALSKPIERALTPFTVLLQVTPIIAIAPLILIYIPSTLLALLLIAFIVSFFPILSNTSFGLNAADKNLRDLFQLYGASRIQTLFLLRLPTALPYFLSGLKIASGLSLIGAVVAEFTAGSFGTGSGLAFRLLEASYRVNIPRLFACVFLISATGLVLYALFSWLTRLLLRGWHETSL